MENANYIPLGVKGGNSDKAENFTSSKTGVVWGPKVIGEMKQERKVIERETRMKSRKENKKLKSEARAARKNNAALPRKLNRNTEKYEKNKDLKKQREIDLERQKIHSGAVKQAEALAAIHDPTGKTFNVGEIIVLPGGLTKTKDGLRKAAQEKEGKQREDAARQVILQEYKEAEAAAKLEAQQAQQAEKEGRPVPTYFPAKEALSKLVRPKRISKKQLQKQEQLKPKPVPPRPIIPEGFSLPDDEENLLALWDLTDDDIKKRLIKKKKEKAAEWKDLVQNQKEAKNIKKAMKGMKKNADDAGIIFDIAAARKEILDAQAICAKKKKEAGKKKDLDSNSESSSDLDSDADMEEAKVDPIEREEKKHKRTTPPKFDVTNMKEALELERAQQAKKQAARERRKQERKQKEVEDSKTEEEKQLAAAKHAKKEKKAARIAAKLAAETSEKSTKRKRADSDEEISPQSEKIKSPLVPEVKKKNESKRVKSETKETKLKVPYEAVQEHKSKKQKSSDARMDREITERKAKMAAEASNGYEKHSYAAEHWNPEKLTGDAARKEKFLRLLGAGKGTKKESEKDQGEKKDKKSKKQPGVDIDKIALDLERQFEAGHNMKHDGGGKRRGLGA